MLTAKANESMKRISILQNDNENYERFFQIFLLNINFPFFMLFVPIEKYKLQNNELNFESVIDAQWSVKYDDLNRKFEQLKQSHDALERFFGSTFWNRIIKF